MQHVQPDDYNTYMNWHDGLTDSGEGVAWFQCWLRGGAAAQGWGEMIAVDGLMTGTATDNWNLTSVDHNNDPSKQMLVWSTDDPGSYLKNGGADISAFNITGDFFYDTNGDGIKDSGESYVQEGDEVRLWFGSFNNDQAPFDQFGQGIYFDDQGWGNRPSSASPFGAAETLPGERGSVFEAALTIPEPGTALLAVGSLLLVLTGRQRRQSSVTQK